MVIDNLNLEVKKGEFEALIPLWSMECWNITI